jgi:hypothetical protein
MALVDDDQIEEAGRELAEQLLTLLGAGDCLIETKVYFVSRVDSALLVDGGSQVDGAAVVALDGLGTRSAFPKFESYQAALSSL